jgi:hypothetical protein
MTDHDRCQRATWHPIDGEGSPLVRLKGEWRCFACDEPLARLNGRVVWFLPPLRELDTKRDGLTTFGLAQRALRGKTARGRAGKAGWDMGQHTPVFVYCPQAGVCGRGQHLHDDALAATVE